MDAKWAGMVVVLAACRGSARGTMGDGGWVTPFADDPPDAQFQGIAVAPLPPEEIDIVSHTDVGDAAAGSLLAHLGALGNRCEPLPKDQFPHAALTLVFDQRGRVESSTVVGLPEDGGVGVAYGYDRGPDSYLQCIARRRWQIGPFLDEHDRTERVEYYPRGR